MNVIHSDIMDYALRHWLGEAHSPQLEGNEGCSFDVLIKGFQCVSGLTKLYNSCSYLRIRLPRAHA